MIAEFIDAELLLKLALTAILVVVATGFAARFGAFVGAMIAAIPISAGPAYLFIAMENTDAFIAQSALTSLGVNPMTVVFLLVMALTIERFGLVASLAFGMGTWFAGAFLATEIGLTFWQACMWHVVVFAICIHLSLPMLGDVSGGAAKRGVLDIVLRVIAVVSVVGSAIVVGRIIGPKAAGLVALIPVVWISMAVVTTARLGGAACSAVLANGIFPMIGFWLGLCAIHLLAEPYGSDMALGVALVLCVGWTLGVALARPFLPMYDRDRTV